MFDELEQLGEKVDTSNLNDSSIQELIDEINSLYKSNKAIINYYEMLMGAMKKVQSELMDEDDDLIYIDSTKKCDFYIIRPKKIITGNHKDGFELGLSPWKCEIESNGHSNYIELNTSSEKNAIEYAKDLIEETKKYEDRRV